MIARAFHDDPVSEYLFPNPADRPGRSAAFYGFVLSMMQGHGAVYVEDEIRGAALWQAPSPPRPGPVRTFMTGLALWAAIRGAMSRLTVMGRAISKAHLREPHWYLGVLGTDPDAQGQGIGSALIEPVLQRCDAEGLPAYLESSKERNLSFYRRHGFEVDSEIQVPDGPMLWPMTRRPG
jgi:ribosomal protein S18 acetylase RimI-like enzyme